MTSSLSPTHPLTFLSPRALPIVGLSGSRSRSVPRELDANETFWRVGR